MSIVGPSSFHLPWAEGFTLKEAGRSALVDLLEGMNGITAKLFTDVLGKSTADLEGLLMECK